MTKIAVTLKAGDINKTALGITEQKLLKKQGGQSLPEALRDYIRERNFTEVLSIAIENGKVVVEIVHDAIQRFITTLSNLLHSQFHKLVDADYETLDDAMVA